MIAQRRWPTGPTMRTNVPAGAGQQVTGATGLPQYLRRAARRGPSGSAAPSRGQDDPHGLSGRVA